MTNQNLLLLKCHPSFSGWNYSLDSAQIPELGFSLLKWFFLGGGGGNLLFAKENVTKSRLVQKESFISSAQDSWDAECKGWSLNCYLMETILHMTGCLALISREKSSYAQNKHTLGLSHAPAVDCRERKSSLSFWVLLITSRRGTVYRLGRNLPLVARCYKWFSCQTSCFFPDEPTSSFSSITSSNAISGNSWSTVLSEPHYEATFPPTWAHFFITDCLASSHLIYSLPRALYLSKGFPLTEYLEVWGF